MTRPEMDCLQVVLSFDVEEHHRIESAAGLVIPPDWEEHYHERVEISTRRLLDDLAQADAKATFFVVGDLAVRHPALVRAMHDGGHEVASHGWDHRRVHHFTPETFRQDVRRSKDALEQITGSEVVGYRAPTFSIGRETAWALDVLGSLGIHYDSSIYPVRHDRYGVADAPRWPFRASGGGGELLELPPMTWRVLGLQLPLGGGGYFRLLPLWMMHAALRQVASQGRPPVAMLYFHPWEFDPEQRRMPLKGLNRFRTYVGMESSRRRLGQLLGKHRFTRAADVAGQLLPVVEQLPRFELVTARPEQAPAVGVTVPQSS